MPGQEALSAVEALVLLDPMRAGGARTLKLAMMALLAQGSITAGSEEIGRFFGRSRSIVRLRVRSGRPPAFPGGPALVKLVGPGGCSMPQFVARAREAYGKGLSGFVRGEVRPALVRRRLLEEREERVLLLFRRWRWHRTAAGERECRRVEQAMAQMRAIPDYLDRDPAQAAALAASFGTAILLVDGLQPHYRRLAQALRDEGGPDGASGSGPIFDDGRALSLADHGGFCLGDLDFGAFDSFDSGFGAFDSGFDAASGDGGGDSGGGGSDGGGGGDGGSSGC